MEATDDEVAASVDDAATDHDTTGSIDGNAAADGETTTPTTTATESTDEDEPATDGTSDSSWSPTACPSCGNAVLMEVVMGPSEAHLAPCGCRVAPGHLQRQRD